MDSKFLAFDASSVKFQFLDADGDVMEKPPTSWAASSWGATMGNYTVNAPAMSKVMDSIAMSNPSSVTLGSASLFEEMLKTQEQARASRADRPEVKNREDYVDAAEEALWAGADHMAAHGWTAGVDCNSQGEVCLRGAVALASSHHQVASFMHPHQRLAMDLVAEYLQLPEDDSPISWNDRQRRKFDSAEIACKEVVETMRLAWEKSRRERGLL